MPVPDIESGEPYPLLEARAARSTVLPVRLRAWYMTKSYFGGSHDRQDDP